LVKMLVDADGVAPRVSLVKRIPWAEIWYTRDRGSVVGSIRMRGGERESSPV
jgi:hypothetical protein